MKNLSLDAATVVDSPIGEIFIGLKNQNLVSVEILTAAHKRSSFSSTSKDVDILSEARQQLGEFFRGQRARFDLPLFFIGTDFQMAVWQEISKLNKGEILSYGELATAIGKPLAARAVGAAVGANPLPIIIGCHRILGSNSKITGYSGGNGLQTKRWLLEHEQIGYKN
jgi:methylated-DNA-[protein]-cysteine S-methyltransferase